MNAHKLDVVVRMNPLDKSKIVDTILSREQCESAYALCHSAGQPLGDRNEDLKAYFAGVLQMVPKNAEGGILCPIPAEVVASVLGLCYMAAFMQNRSGVHLDWVDRLTNGLESALRESHIRVKIDVDGRRVFAFPPTELEDPLGDATVEGHRETRDRRFACAATDPARKPWWRFW
ncbi:MAG: hypothetical protein ABSH34_04205 [Verrucomicrobiota bacterium]|jgi:hypothetical protein